MRTAHSSSHACLDTPPYPQVWAWRSPRVWAWRPPQARPLNLPPGCGPGHLQGMLGYPSPSCGQNERQCKNITLQTSFAGCNNRSEHPSVVEAAQLGNPGSASAPSPPTLDFTKWKIHVMQNYRVCCLWKILDPPLSVTVCLQGAELHYGSVPQRALELPEPQHSLKPDHSIAVQ